MKQFLKRVCAAVLVCCALFSASAQAKYSNPFISPLGSCYSITGTTVIVTIFVSDPVNSWDFNQKADMDTYSKIYYRLKTATEWLTKQIKRYGANPTFVWDWYNQDYLYYTYTSDRYLARQDYTYQEIRTFIQNNIDLERIKRYYRADNVVFLACYDDPPKTYEGCTAWNWDYEASGANKEYALEIIWISDEDRHAKKVSAASFAHEIMHCFGAVDLYTASENIPQRYVNHLKSSKSKDIMFAIDYNTPESIGEKFTELDAYYLGLTRNSADQKKYGLGIGSHWK